jgi:hypothetical protein
MPEHPYGAVKISIADMEFTVELRCEHHFGEDWWQPCIRGDGR